MADEARTFKLTTPHMQGKDIKAWQQELHDRFRSWNIDYPVHVDGHYLPRTRAAERSFMRAWGIEDTGEALERGMTPALRTKLRNDQRHAGERRRFDSDEIKAYRAALREKHNGGGVAMPVARIIADSNDWAPGHDGIDLICLPNAPLHAIIRAEVIRADNSGWWNKGAPADPALKARGDGIVIIRALETAGPIRKGYCIGYGHAEHMRTRVGQIVEAGHVLALAGLANAWHPHWMVNDGSARFWDGSRPLGLGGMDPRPILDYCRRNA